MAVPTRPASGAPVATDWGQTVHDGVVAYDLQTGTFNLTWASSAVSDVPTITFPRPFAATPTIILTTHDHSGVANHSYGVRTASSTNFTAQGREVRETVESTVIPVFWLAYGPRA